MDFWKEYGLYLVAIAAVIVLAVLAALMSFKKSKMKLPPKTWREANHLK